MRRVGSTAAAALASLSVVLNPVVDHPGSQLLFLGRSATTPGTGRDTWAWTGVLRMVPNAKGGQGAVTLDHLEPELL